MHFSAAHRRSAQKMRVFLAKLTRPASAPLRRLLSGSAPYPTDASSAEGCPGHPSAKRLHSLCASAMPRRSLRERCFRSRTSRSENDPILFAPAGANSARQRRSLCMMRRTAAARLRLRKARRIIRPASAPLRRLPSGSAPYPTDASSSCLPFASPAASSCGRCRRRSTWPARPSAWPLPFPGQ